MHPENSKLLPSPYAELLESPNSILRHPFDYCPTEFKIDPFGGLFEHEYITILPFVE